MSLPIALEQMRDQSFHITNVNWILGTVCNYACSYCPASLHDGNQPWPDIGVAQAFSSRVLSHYQSLDREVCFVFSGGEPTAYKHLPQLAETVKAAGGRVRIITNGSRAISWWPILLPHLDSVVLSHHIEHVNIEQFLAVTQYLASRVRVHVNVTMLPERFDDCMLNATRVAASDDAVTVTLKPLLLGFGSQMYPYTDGQIRVMTEFVIGRPLSDAPEKATMRLRYCDGKVEQATCSQLVVRKLNQWAGWSCDIGVESLAIDQFGRVSLATCKQGGDLGRIDDPTLKLPTSGIICGKRVCHCLSDIAVSKRRIMTRDNREQNVASEHKLEDAKLISVASFADPV